MTSVDSEGHRQPNVPQEGGPPPGPPSLKRQGTNWNLIGEWFTAFIAFFAIAAVVLIFIFLFREASPILFDAVIRAEVTLGSMFQWQGISDMINYWQPVSDEPRYGIWPLIAATLKISLLAVALALPVGLMAAIYSAEFAPRALREIIKPVVELLAGIPSVVLGFFALMILANWLQALFGWDYRLNSALAAIALSIMVIPILFSVAEDALLAVPQNLREASAALGATRIQTAFRTVVPAALPGLFGAVVLSVGRVIGETMVVLMVAGNAAIFNFNVFDPARTLSATIASEMAEVVTGSPHYTVLFVLGVVLLIMTSFLNGISDWVMTRFMRKLHGKAR